MSVFLLVRRLFALLALSPSQDEAVKVMDQFGWGAEFLRVNADVLETYAACSDGAEVVKAQVGSFCKKDRHNVRPSCVCASTMSHCGTVVYGVYSTTFFGSGWGWLAQ